MQVLAKTARTHRALCQQFEHREVKKKYIALLEGPIAQGEGILSLPLGPDLDDMPHQHVDHEQGKEAVTHYVVLGTEEHKGQRVTRVAFSPQTGRTHQLRVHASHPMGLNCPIVGDRLYGTAATRLMLHAERITFTHPATGQQMTLDCPPDF
jgi:tRNA pseudouridine32 synthase/23S rRNA pseudouridine746 synthase